MNNTTEKADSNEQTDADAGVEVKAVVMFWCLVGNIVKERDYGSEGEKRPGTKHFSGGTKVYCLPAQWGDGYEKIVVIGRGRKTKRFITVIIPSIHVENWRVKAVYNPEVVRRFKEDGRYSTWKNKEQAERYLASLVTR